MIVKTARL